MMMMMIMMTGKRRGKSYYLLNGASVLDNLRNRSAVVTVVSHLRSLQCFDFHNNNSFGLHIYEH